MAQKITKKVVALILEAHNSLTRFNPDFSPTVHHIQKYIDDKLKIEKVKKHILKESKKQSSERINKNIKLGEKFRKEDYSWYNEDFEKEVWLIDSHLERQLNYINKQKQKILNE